MRLRKLLKVWNLGQVKMTKTRKLELMVMKLKEPDPTNHKVKMYLAIRRLNHV